MCEWAKQQRYDFVKHSPDLVVYMHALRAELIMRMVMPAVLGSSSAVPALGYARFETGPNGNPHWHGVGYGRGNPRLDEAGTELLEECERILAAWKEDEKQEHGNESGGSAEERGDGGARKEEAGVSTASSGSIDTDADVAEIVETDPGNDSSRPAGPRGARRGAGRGRPKRGARGRGAGRAVASEAEPLPPQCIPCQSLPAKAHAPEAVTKEAKEIAFWMYFKDRVSEWNPCFGDDEEVRFLWDREVGAHDIEVAPDVAAADLSLIHI